MTDLIETSPSPEVGMVEQAVDWPECPKRGEIRVIDGQRCRFIERELEGDKWEVLGPTDPDLKPAASGGVEGEGSDLRGALHAALCDYRLNNIRDDDGYPFPLIDLFSNEGMTIETGNEELFSLADYLVADERVMAALHVIPSTPPQVEREGSRDDLEALDLDAMEKVAKRMCRRNWTDNDSQAFDDTFTPPAVLRLIATNRELLEALQPFAVEMHPDHADDGAPFRSYFSVGDIKRARTAISNTLSKSEGSRDE